MKLFKKAKAVLLAATLLAGTSCKEYLDVNTDPNSPTTVSAGLALSAAELGMAFYIGNDLQRMTGAFIQHYSGQANQLLDYDQYDVTGDEIDNTWEFGFYAGTLRGYREVIRIAENTGQSENYRGVAKIAMAYNYSVITDAFGDVPFSEAIKYEEGQRNPKFDSQQEIYAGLFKMIDEGIADLATPSAVKPGTSDDLIYGGNNAKWVRAANSLKLKMYLQMRKVDPAAATAGINALIAGNNLISSNADDFELKFGSSPNNQHPMFSFSILNREADIAVSQRFIDSLTATNDPRIPFYFEKGTNATYRGGENGIVNTTLTPAVRARLGRYPIGYTGSKTGGDVPQRFLTNFQTQFNLAEAALILGTTGNPRTYYEAGIRASMSKVGVSNTDANTYVNARLAEFDKLNGNKNAQLNMIIRDKWVAWLGNGLEAWNDYRRTGFPQLRITNNPANINVIPRILPYSQSELVANTNAPQQHLLDQKVWWDK